MKLLPLTLSALLLAGYASAQVIGESPVRTFDEADFNADGVLNKREADTALPALAFQDEDDDGIISRADVRKVLPDILFTDDASADAPIRAPEYRQIVDTVRDMLKTDSTIR